MVVNLTGEIAIINFDFATVTEIDMVTMYVMANIGKYDYSLSRATTMHIDYCFEDSSVEGK
jgi:hypothetical protein